MPLSKEQLARGIKPYDYKDPNRQPLAPRMIQGWQVAEALDNAGFPESQWVTGVAIARRESSFVPDLIGAVNSSTRGYDPENASWDFGLFQISHKWNSHILENGDWTDPTDNAKMAKYLFDESVRRGYDGWRPWHTYTSGNYKTYITLAQDAVAEYNRRRTSVVKPPVTKPTNPTPPKKEVSVALVIESNSTVGISKPSGGYANTVQGVVVHYPGAPTLRLGAHTECRQQVRNWDSQHRSQGWSGIGYHYLVCHHGIVMTGRGIGMQGAHAPGANSTHVGVQLMVANDKDATPQQLAGFRSFLVYLKGRGVNTDNITPHSAWISTSCPGNILRSRVASGNWGTGSTPTVPPVPGPGTPSGSKFGPEGSVRSVGSQQKEVNLAGHTPKLVQDSTWGPATEAGVKWYQKKLGVTADGIWGPATDAAHHKRKNGGAPVPSTPKPPTKKKLVVDGDFGPATISELQRALNEGRF